jgi:HK97 gp10 family phage protein
MANAEELWRLLRKHDAIVTAVAESIQPALNDAAADIVAEMKRQAPVLPAATDERQPGELRDSIAATPGDNKVTITAGNEQVPFARYVEFGTSKMTAEPFFFSSIRLLAARTRQKIASTISTAITDAGDAT